MNSTDHQSLTATPRATSLNEEAEVSPKCPYMRVGCDYYRQVEDIDRFGTKNMKVVPWKKAEIIQDHGKKYLDTIPKFDGFTMVPSNTNYQRIIKGRYNLYNPFPWIPKRGEWIWIKRLLEHIFGDQYDLGIRYMQILFQHPERQTIILALVSEARETGKTTFLNFIFQVFQSNVVVLSTSDFLSSFNPYARHNIICIEETFLDRAVTIEKLKAMSTAKMLTINEKYVTPYSIPFYGKVILTSNLEDKFAKVDPAETRFFVRKLGKPKFTNHSIEQDLLREIPAFLHHLDTLPKVDWSVSRSGFTPDELTNESLLSVKKESRSGLAKDLEMRIVDFFEGDGVDQFYATVKDIKTKWFYDNSRIEWNYIRHTLKKDFKMTPLDRQRYRAFNDSLEDWGRPYVFKRVDFGVVTNDKLENGVSQDMPF